MLVCVVTPRPHPLPTTGWHMPIVVKRLDARYDWLPRWSQKSQQSHQLMDVGDGCEPSPSIGGAVAWVSEGNCSFFDKVSELSLSYRSSISRQTACLAMRLQPAAKTSWSFLKFEGKSLKKKSQT